MKITIRIILITYLFGITSATAQVFPVYPEKELDKAEVTVSYMLTYRRDSLDAGKRKELMTLKIGEKTSMFCSEAYYSYHEASKGFLSIADIQAFKRSSSFKNPAFRYMIFKNYPEGKITTADHIPSDYFLYTEDLSLFDWKISDDTSQVKGYRVQKATTFFGGREWVAWFAPEIPFNEGPHKFNGLPGLILEIHDTRSHYTFEVVSIETPKDKPPINFIERPYIKTTKEDFFRAWNSFKHDFIARSAQAGIDGHSQVVMEGKLRSHNNPIELK